MKTNTRRILLIGGTLIVGLVFFTWLLSLSRNKEMDAVQKKPKETKVKLVKYGDLAKYYPMSKMGSFDQTTNNKRYWRTPENGTAVHPEINGLSYGKSDRT
jgi:hypothetical protein